VVVVLLPSLLATEAGGQGRFELDAETVREALRELPIRDLIFDERGQLRPLVNVYVNSAQVDDLEGRLADGDEIRLVAAVAGGGRGAVEKVSDTHSRLSRVCHQTRPQPADARLRTGCAPFGSSRAVSPRCQTP